MVKKIFEWLKSAIENRPVKFVILGGTISYCSAFLFLALSFEMNIYASPIPFGITTLLVIMFHWFVARYERRSKLAQLLALTPALLLVFTTMWMSKLTVDHNVCTRDSSTQQINCRWWGGD